MATFDDLYAQLPPGVAQDLGAWSKYQGYRTFTWPWLFRRSAVFWPLALLGGAIYGTWHASGTGAWGDWPGLTLRACIAWLVAVSLGPILATIVRHCDLPLRIERILVISAILTGLAVGYLVFGWASTYHEFLMHNHSGQSMRSGLFGRLMSNIVLVSIDTANIALMVAGGGIGIIYYGFERRRIEQFKEHQQIESIRAERDAADMRLSVLQAQIEPHFLFNTLASIRSLIDSEPARAAETTDALAGYLRATLPHFRETRSEEVTLDHQIEICVRYLELMNIRVAGRIHITVEATANARALPFPPLLLLTLVENAVKHGIEPKPGPCSIMLCAQTSDSQLVLTVEDDGAGLQTGFGSGVGLANIRAQLQNLFGALARLDVATRPGGGTIARITVPLMR